MINDTVEIGCYYLDRGNSYCIVKEITQKIVYYEWFNEKSKDSGYDHMELAEFMTHSTYDKKRNTKLWQILNNKQ